MWLASPGTQRGERGSAHDGALREERKKRAGSGGQPGHSREKGMHAAAVFYYVL